MKYKLFPKEIADKWVTTNMSVAVGRSRRDWNKEAFYVVSVTKNAKNSYAYDLVLRTREGIEFKRVVAANCRFIVVG